MNLSNYFQNFIFKTEQDNELEKIFLFINSENGVNRIKEENYVIQGD